MEALLSLRERPFLSRSERSALHKCKQGSCRSMPNEADKRWCIIFNPAAARGRAEQKLKQLQPHLHTKAELRATERAGHAVALARDAAQAGFDVVAAAGGDGTVHEVANGLLEAQNATVEFAVVPLGSANDYAYSLRKTFPDAANGVRPLDVGVVSDASGRRRYFVNTLGLGFSGSVALESRRIHRLQGLPLYSLAFFRALAFRYACPAMTVDLDGTARTAPTLSLTLAIGHREGSFVVAPQAVLDDGWFDLLHAGPLSRWEVLRYMPKLASGGQLPSDHPAIWLGRCRTMKLQSTAPLTVHLDGEFFCKPEDDVRSLEVALLPAHLRVRSLAGEDQV